LNFFSKHLDQALECLTQGLGLQDAGPVPEVVGVVEEGLQL
jgi:hypothetical protein